MGSDGNAQGLIHEGQLLRRLKALVALRVFFVTVLLGSFIVFQIGYGAFPFSRGVQYLIVSLYVLSIIYAFLIGRVRGYLLAYVQLLIDVASAILLITFTGGIESWFSWLLLLIVMSAALVLNRRAAYIMATASALLYGAVIDLQFYAIVPVPYYSLLVERDFLYKIFSHILGLYLIAYFAGQLVERLERKNIDFEELAMFNRAVIESTPSGLFTTDNAGVVKLFNRAAEEITGMSRYEAVERPIVEIFPFVRDIARTFRDEQTVSLQGSEKVIGLSVSRLYDLNGNQTGYIGMFQDMTELRRMMREVKKKEALATVGELSAKIAHEIRNPLASLRSSVEMLKEGTVREEQKSRLMQIALSEMDRLNHIITDFLQFSRPKDTVLKEFNLHAQLEETLEMLRQRGDTRAEIRGDFAGALMINADAEKLNEVFWNLGINALEAMPERGILRVTTALSGQDVIIVFSDTGVGISKTDQERIFFPFFTTKSSGTGLGLSTAYRAVEDHHGTIRVTSEPGAGTVFTVIIPRGL